MKNNTWEIAKSIILNRRTVKVQKMNGTNVPDDVINKLLVLADSAPTHGRTEPWRFIIFQGQSFQKFCEVHAEMYWNCTPDDVKNELKRDHIARQYHHASHLIIVWMRSTPNSKIPWHEEYAATAAAIQNILLGAQSLGIKTFWSTGGAASKDEMKSYLKLSQDDFIVGFIYLGFLDSEPEMPLRKIPLSDKTQFFR